MLEGDKAGVCEAEYGPGLTPVCRSCDDVVSMMIVGGGDSTMGQSHSKQPTLRTFSPPRPPLTCTKILTNAILANLQEFTRDIFFETILKSDV